MTDKEMQIRVNILPQLERFSDALFDDINVARSYARKLDKITDELNTILNLD